MSAFAAMCLLCLGITLTAWGAIGLFGCWMRIRHRTATPPATNQATRGVSVKSSHTDWTRAAWAEVNEGAD